MYNLKGIKITPVKLLGDQAYTSPQKSDRDTPSSVTEISVPHIYKIVKVIGNAFLNKKSQELFSVLGLQSSKGLNNLDYDDIIHQSRNIVKFSYKKKDSLSEISEVIMPKLAQLNKKAKNYSVCSGYNCPRA